MLIAHKVNRAVNKKPEELGKVFVTMQQFD